VTPPVALAAYAAASIAKTDPLRTGFEASKLVFAGYIIPYLVIYNPGLMLRGTLTEIFLSFALALFCTFFVAVAMEGYGTRGSLNFLERLLAFTAAIILPFPILFDRATSFFVALAFLALFMAQQRLRRQKMVLAMAAAPARKKS
jgi:TRAP-type uncharacterized transport system fused permease subunit